MFGPQIRLLSEDGASFALVPVPSLVNFDYPRIHIVDIELLTPGRLVRYLGRSLPRDSLARLAEAFMHAAQVYAPEQTVATVHDDAAGLAVLFNASTSFAVTVEVVIQTDLDLAVSDRDNVAFEVPRSALIDAAHAIDGWLE